MNRRILIVDDDPASLRLMNSFLTGANYDVLQTSNAAEALQIVMNEAPPLIVVDYSLCGMSGAEFCRVLRSHEGVRFAYVLIVTACSDTERLVEAFDAGADDYLPKPINRQEFLARLRAGERIAKLEENLAKRTRDIHRLNAQSALVNQQLEEANVRLRTMATTDELTGLFNRREVMARLADLWSSVDRYGHALSCAMIDIDHFKKFNDSYGHAAGDMVLRETAAVLKSTVRSTDVLARMGGEEFLIICPHVGINGGATCAEHLRAAVAARRFLFEGAELRVTISLGVAERCVGMVSPDDLLRSADDALYKAKAGGRNQVTKAIPRTDLVVA